jgi:hypothetical protein
MGDEGSAFGRFLVSNPMTLSGSGEIVLGQASVNSGIALQADLVIDPGLTIHGARGTIGTSNRRLVLRSPVTAEAAGREINLQGDSLLVEAPVTAVGGGSLKLDGPMAVRAKASVTGGGTLRLTGPWVNENTLEAGTGTALDLDGTWTNAGLIRPTDATTTLGGTFAWADVGDFVRVGGTVTLDGTMNNSAHALVLDANTGTWLLSGGSILGGSV